MSNKILFCLLAGLIIFAAIVFSPNICFGMAGPPPQPPSEDTPAISGPMVTGEVKGTIVNLGRAQDIALKLTKIIDRIEHDVYPNVSKGKEMIIFSSITSIESNYNIWTSNLDGKELTQVTNDYSNNEDPEFFVLSKKEERILFSSDRLYQYKLWSKKLSGIGGNTQITLGVSSDFYPDVNFIKRKIAFCSMLDRYKSADSLETIGQRWRVFDGGFPYIWAINLDGTNLTQIIDGVKPRWSPKGDRILFFRNNGTNYDIWVMAPNGENLTQLTSTLYDEVEPSWSPDGEKIVYVSNHSGQYKIWVMGSDGSEPTQVTFGNSIDGGPVWSPDGKYIYFHSLSRGNWDIWRIEF